MNLQSIVAPYISAVNPSLRGSWRQSNGEETFADGTRKPRYAYAEGVDIQCQALSFKDLVQVNGLNMGGVKQAFYVNGNIEGVSRPDARGGDLFKLPDGSIWLVALVLENWNRTAGWTKVAVVLQNDVQWGP